MNSKNIAKNLNKVIKEWTECIYDKDVVQAIKKDAIITGGALVSLLNNEEPNDYDVYFKTKESCYLVADYYAKKWNNDRPLAECVSIENEEIISCFTNYMGIVSDTSSWQDEGSDNPRCFSTNAISLSNKIQIIIRFCGSVEEIHENYDFAHCTCSYDFCTNKVSFPNKALECIINKQLYYQGSKYPLCSIIRTRKFIGRGWTIDAGQYLKMCLQLNDFDLHDAEVLKDQLTGVDSYYFNRLIKDIEKRKTEDKNFKVDNNYLFDIINEIF